MYQNEEWGLYLVMGKKKVRMFLVVMLVFAMLFSACGTAATTAETSIINLVMFSSPDGFVSYFGAGGLYTNMAANGLIFESLTKLNDKWEICPALADSWTISDDSLVYTFNLNKDAKWHDGEPFTAKDVAFTLKCLMDPEWSGAASPYVIGVKGGVAYKNGDADDVEGIKIIDDHTIELTMEKPYAPFLEGLAANIPILPEHLLGDTAVADLPQSPFLHSPIGTGPAKFNQYVTDQYVEYDMNKEYYRGAPKFDKLILKIMTSDLALTAFMKGELDATTNSGLGTMPATDYETLLGVEGIKVESYATNTVQFITLNYAKSEISDVRFRQAVVHAIDKESIVEQLLGGIGTPVSSSIPPFSPYYNPDVPQREYSPEKAKELLAEMDWDSDTTLILSVPKGQVMRERMAPIIQQYLAAVGIKVELEFGEFASLVEQIETAEFDMALFGVGAAMIDPNAAYLNYFHSSQTRSNGGWNMGNYNNPEVDRLLEEGTATTDMEERKAIYNRMQEIEYETPNFLNIYFENAVGVISDRVSGIVFSATGPIWNIVEWEVVG